MEFDNIIKEFTEIIIKKCKEKYKKQELIERCYKEIEILETNNQLLLIYILYICKENSKYKYHFRGMINNLFILYLLDLSIVNPIEYNLPYELYNDKSINVDIIDESFLVLVYDILNLLSKSSYTLVKCSFIKDKDEEINMLQDNHYLLINKYGVDESLQMYFNQEGILTTVKPYKKNTFNYPIIVINEKSLDTKLIRNDFEKNLVAKLKPTKLEHYVKIISFSHGAFVWNNNQEYLNVPIDKMISSREDVFDYLIFYNIDRTEALEITDFIRKGLVKKNIDKWQEYVKVMKEHGCEDEFINICSKILYLFGRGQAISECLWLGEFK